MILTEADIRRITRLGYRASDFIIYRDGFPRLRNVDGHCYFLDPDKRVCKIYKYRPVGCRIYPLIYDLEHGFRLDDECPAVETISGRELYYRVLALKRVLRELSLLRS